MAATKAAAAARRTSRFRKALNAKSHTLLNKTRVSEARNQKYKADLGSYTEIICFGCHGSWRLYDDEPDNEPVVWPCDLMRARLRAGTEGVGT